MQSSGIRKIPNRIENTAKNFQSYQASSITCGIPNPDDITVIGNLIFNGSVVSGLQPPQSSSQPVTLGYLEQQQQYAQLDVTIGMIQIWFKPTSTIPENYLLCDGSQFDELIYPGLFTVLGTNILPDLRNKFIRGDQTGSNASQNVPQSQIPLANHAHLYEKTIQTAYFATERIWAPLNEFRQYTTTFQSQSFYDQTLPVGTNNQEFYPAYTSVNYIIKAKSTQAFRNSLQNDQSATSSLIANVDRLTANSQLDMNNYKIISLQQPVNQNDIATKSYVDQAIVGGQINRLENGNEQLILQTTELQSTVVINMQSNKIINVADATSDQDALNRQTADNRYYLNSATSQNILPPTSQLNMNQQKISNMATGTLFNDAVVLQQLQQWIALTTTINQVPATPTWVLPFQEITQTSTQYLMYNPVSNRVILTQAGLFDVQILIRGTYTSFNQPITFRINSTNGIIQKSVTQQQPTSNGTLTTTRSQFIVSVQPAEFWLEIISNPSVITLNAGCYLLAKKMY